MFKAHSTNDIINDINKSLKPLKLKTRIVNIDNIDFDSGKVVFEGSKGTTIHCKFTVDSFQSIHFSDLRIDSLVYEEKNAVYSSWNTCVEPKKDNLVDFLDAEYYHLSPIDRIVEIQMLMKTLSTRNSAS